MGDVRELMFGSGGVVFRVGVGEVNGAASIGPEPKVGALQGGVGPRDCGGLSFVDLDGEDALRGECIGDAAHPGASYPRSGHKAQADKKEQDDEGKTGDGRRVCEHVDEDGAGEGCPSDAEDGDGRGAGEGEEVAGTTGPE